MPGWWDRHVVPRMIRCGCSSEMMTDLRRKVVPRAQGRVLDLGVGAGANFPLYDPLKVTSLTGIDPSEELLDYARKAATGLSFPCTLIAASGEALPFGDDSFDTVVITFTLCTVPDPEKVLAEARRVLKPGGALLFLEHAASPEPGLLRWQGRIEPLWSRLTGNCHLTRPAIGNVARSGLSLEEQHGFHFPGKPGLLSWFEWGIARKA